MSEDKEQNKEIDTPSEKNDGSHPGEEIKEDDRQCEITADKEKQNSVASEKNHRDESADPQDRRTKEQSAPTEAAKKISEEVQAVEDFDLNLLLDIPLEITVELGRSKIQIQELLELGPGSTVTLSKLEGEPVDILANDKLIARGEVVLQNKKYGIRITEITSRMDRIKSLS